MFFHHLATCNIIIFSDAYLIPFDAYLEQMWQCHDRHNVTKLNNRQTIQERTVCCKNVNKFKYAHYKIHAYHIQV